MLKSKKRSLLLFLTTVTGCWLACNSHDDAPKNAENALDAGREFVRASLDGNYKKAAFFLLEDSTNQNLLTRWEESYRNLSSDDREAFRRASITINSEEEVSDSVSIINFSNSYKKKPQVLKVIKRDGTWKVDFKYTFSGNL
ncbi:DUF4878 domain-containing protein [Parasegetibacter sp. NRK P23]|uniref:DUF4878 domain-containing protein n=1 Tax=Parasegetibacter sp. NRK P23 TaxID=2942999 RepID=UPI00204456ED|nr:DUF4878 domain-containing protein [Parasegetibacter sp. NRK P23]MCM5528857.1 DUF4878 domain-containing protein [Parasegetibacter sp. NRK P23]